MLKLCFLALAISTTTISADPLFGDRVFLPQNRTAHWLKANDSNRGPFFGQPEQVHISYGGDPSRIIVTWLTFDDTLQSVVHFGADLLSRKVKGRASRFVDGGPKKSVRYIHRAVLDGIEPDIRYFYRVGSEFGWSNLFSFVGLRERPEGGFKFAVFGDLGNKNARSLGKIQREAQDGVFDMILHVGDFAYDLDSNDGTVGDEFFRQIEPAAARVPYMTVSGNHEAAFNFSHFVHRFSNPGTSDNHYYSFDLGPVHVIAVSTELYWTHRNTLLPAQWQWLRRDLAQANANRKKVPWIVTLGHRPMYCTTTLARDCSHPNSIVRVGLYGNHTFALEKLFFDHGVDLAIWAHEHAYERQFPTFDGIVYNGTLDPYHDPPAPVHLISGSAGCAEKLYELAKHPAPWSAFRSVQYGFGRLQVFNATHLYYEQTRAGEDIEDDSFWLVKTKHYSYNTQDLKRLRKFGFQTLKKEV